MKKPRVFIGSSSEGYHIAQYLQRAMSGTFLAKTWKQDAFALTKANLDNLFTEMAINDFGVFVLSPDDHLVARGLDCEVGRDNVIFEAGLFMGYMGIKHVVLVAPKGHPSFHVFSDMNGYSVAQYDEGDYADEPLTAMSLVATEIERSFLAAAREDITNAKTTLLGTYSGRRDHYKVASQMLEDDCRELVLLQYSSTIILGPEEGCEYEKRFYDLLHARISEGASFYHVTTFDGIQRHLDAENRTYPALTESLLKLDRVTSNVLIKANGRVSSIRVISGKDPDSRKFAPAFAVAKSDGRVESLFVVNIGTSAFCFHMSGGQHSGMMKQCSDFYYSCTKMTWSELESVLHGRNHRE